MQVKKFEAATIQEALEMVKSQLGPDAIILSARDNKKSFGLIGKGSVEITAAVSELQLRKKQVVESKLMDKDRQRFQNIPARMQKEIIEKSLSRFQQGQAQSQKPEPRLRREVTSQRYIDISDGGQAGEPVARNVRPSHSRPLSQMKPSGQRAVEENSSYGRTGQKTQNPRASAPSQPPQGRRVGDLLDDIQKDVTFQESRPDDVGLQRVKAAVQSAWDAVAGSDEPKFAPRPVASKAQEMPSFSRIIPSVTTPLPSPVKSDVANLKAEIQQLKEVIQNFRPASEKMMTMHPGANFGIPFELSFMFEKLTQAGVSEEYATRVLSDAQKGMDVHQIKKRALVEAWVARHLLEQVTTTPKYFAQRIHLFVGAGGQGKTSCLVKMASHLVIQERKKVAIITTDTFKVGAIDQLRIYSQILNVPFGVVRSRSDWPTLLHHLEDYDYILVDFPGLSLKTPEELDFLSHLMPARETSPETSRVVHYVQSVMTKDADAFLSGTRYQSVGYDDVIFTNLDEATNHGLIYNFQQAFGTPLHSFGIGPLIPEDYELATRERVLDLIFKISKLKTAERGI